MLSHFNLFKNTIGLIVRTHHFERDWKGFDSSIILDSEYAPHLHKYEENVFGNHVFRALYEKKHVVYAIDKEHRLILLRAFSNFKEYCKFLDDKHEIKRLIDHV